MVLEKSPVTSDQYAEKYSSLNTLHLGPSLSTISERQLLVSSTWNSEVYTMHDWETFFYFFFKDIKLFTQPLVKSPDKYLGLNRLCPSDDANIFCLQAGSTKTCAKRQICYDVIRIP